MEKVLVISYRFPPADETGTQRTWALAKYLKGMGYYPVFITRNWDVPLKSYEDIFIPTGNQIEHKCFDDYELYSLPHRDILKNKLNRKFRNKYSFLKKIFNFIDYLCMYLGYFGLNEFNKFVQQAEKVVANNREIKKAIIITDPYPLFYVGYYLNKKFGIRWIADYRDDWNTREVNDTYGFKKTVFHQLIDWITIRLEKRWVRTATYVTSVSDAYTNRIASFVGVQGRTIYNGYFEEDYSSYLNGINTRIRNSSQRTFTIIHNGSLYPLQDVETFLSAYKTLCDRYMGKINLFLKFIGVKYKKGSKERIDRLMIGYDSNYECTDRVPQDIVFKEINEAQATLLISFGKSFKGLATSKIYDYIALNKSVICYPRDFDVVDDILVKSNLGILCDTEKEIIQSLDKLILEYWETNDIVVTPSYTNIAWYSRKNQTNEVAKLLRSI